MCLVAAFSPALIMSAQSAIGPLLTTSWHQKAPYNLHCPMTEEGGTVHSAAGCGAIAVSQILTKYGKPIHGFGHSYYVNGKSGIMTDVDYSQLTMDWDQVQDSYSSTIMGTQAEDAVASIVYQVGGAMQMSYSTSSAPKNMGQMMWGLQHYLHMNPQSRYRRRTFYSTAEWIEMLHRELFAGRPVYYRGQWTYNNQTVAHIFVIDGFRQDGKYHVNFGHGASTNKYADLSILNFTNQHEYPGGRSVCYNDEQSMITDFYPVDGLSDEDYSQHSLILSSNIYFADDEKIRERFIPLGGSLKLKMDIRDCSLTGGSLPFGLGIYRDGILQQVLRDRNRPNISFNGGGLVGNRSCSITLPNMLENGHYELRLVSSPNNGVTWEDVWDNAPNQIDMIINNGIAQIVLLPDYTQETHLFLREPIHEVPNVFQNVSNGVGTAFRLALSNPSNNNFENNIRFTIDVDGVQYYYDVRCAIYGWCDVDFDILVPASVIDLKGKSYTVSASYYEQNLDSYLELYNSTINPIMRGDVDGDCQVTIADVTSLIDYMLSGNADGFLIDNADVDNDSSISIGDVTSMIDDLLNGDNDSFVLGVALYDDQGRLVIELPYHEVQSHYAVALSNLPHGKYTVREGDRTRELEL